MLLKKLDRLPLLTIIIFFLLTGCSAINEEYELLSGPDSVIRAENLEQSTENYLVVQQLLLERAGLSAPPADRSQDWLKFIDAGFHYVDEKCNRFLAAIHKHERIYKAKRDQIDAFRILTREILSEVSTAAKVINITASSFDLATKSVKNLRNSLILALPSNVVIKTVKRERAAFKSALAEKSWTYLWSTRAMNAVAQYLNICVPANIEASIQNTLHLAEYDVTDDGEVVATAIKQSIRRPVSLSPLIPIPSQKQTRPDSQMTSESSTSVVNSIAIGASSDFERENLRSSDVANIQSSLCVTEDGILGPLTRESIKSYERYFQYHGIPDDGIDGILNSEEYKAILSIGQCPSSKYAGYLERFLFDLNGRPNNVFIQQFQKSLNAVAAMNSNGRKVTFAEDGKLDSLLDRNKLKIINQHLLNLPSSRINSRLYLLLVQSFGLPQ